MQCLTQRVIQTHVYRRNGGTINVQTTSHEKGVEQIISLAVEQDTFLVSEARLETFSMQAGETIFPLRQLCGVKAYLDGGAGLKLALNSLDKQAAALFAEAVRGVVQAETYLLKERGFSSPSEYGRYWESMYAGSCRYYSNLDRIGRLWDEYVGSGERSGQLFWRSKTCLLYSLGQNCFLTVASLADTFHELNVRLKTSDAIIQSAEADFLRVPDPVCSEAASFLANLAGKEFAQIRKKELAVSLGGGQGCIHLIDLVDDALDTVKSYLELAH